MRNSYLDLLKFMAIFIMILDHIGNFLLPQDLFTTHVIRGIGRVAMPLFFITHGYLLAVLPHLPSLARIVKLLGYGAFLSISLFAVTDELTLNILFQFALIDMIWRLHLSAGILKKTVIVLMLEIAIFLLLIEQVISLEQIIDYGVYPLFYGIVGLMLGYARQYSDQKMERWAFLILIAALSFEYNPFLALLTGIYVDNSLLYFALPACLIPFLAWYIAKNVSVDLAAMRPLVTVVSRHTLEIYVFHLQLIIIFLLINLRIS